MAPRWTMNGPPRGVFPRLPRPNPDAQLLDSVRQVEKFEALIAKRICLDLHCSLREVPPNLSAADIVREHPKILAFESDPAGDNRRMDVQLVCELHDRYRGRPLPYGA